jgi:hypothetical protein
VDKAARLLRLGSVVTADPVPAADDEQERQRETAAP